MDISPQPDDDLLALRLRALGHPARLAIVRALAARERCVCGEIVKGLPLAQSTVSQHLKVLKEAGLIAGTVEGPRSCYCLDREGFATLAAALGPLLDCVMLERAETHTASISRAPGPLAPATAQPISTATVGKMPLGT